MVLLDAAYTNYVAMPMFIWVIGLLSSLNIGCFMFAYWISREVSKNGQRLSVIEERSVKTEVDLKDEKKAQALERNAISNEIQSFRSAVFNKIDDVRDSHNKKIDTVKTELTNELTGIKVFCAGHNAQTRELVIDVLKDHDLIKSK